MRTTTTLLTVLLLAACAAPPPARVADVAPAPAPAAPVLPASGLEVVDPALCFVVPGQVARLRWRAAVRGGSDSLTYTLADYAGRAEDAGSAQVGVDGVITVERAFARGYHEITLAGQVFGIVALEPHAGEADPFFGIDAALSWLETDPARRDGLVRILARSGIAMARERMGLGAVNPEAGTYVWDKPPRTFDSLRRIYAAQRVPVLEMLNGGARHLEPGAGGYPGNFPQLLRSDAELVRRWGAGWGGLEVENEPDLKPVPAEQYVALVKAASRAHAAAGSAVPLVTGVFGGMPPGSFFDACAANGLLADSDVLSFHSYDRAPSVEPMLARYRAWLAAAGAADLPLWHSECGWPWAKGPGRPPAAQDADSAMEIAAKGAESLACGVARYFPFVLVYYEEGPKNFGMMGREATPLRSMAAYVASVQALSGLRYLGDLRGVGSPVRLARVFGAAGRPSVAVLYAGAPATAVRLPLPMLRAAGADGRELALAAGALPLGDGLAYVWLDPVAAAPWIDGDTPAARLAALGGPRPARARLAAPLVLQFLAQHTPARASARRYLLSQETARALPLRVRIQNLSDAAVTARPALTLPGGQAIPAAAVTVPAMGVAEAAWTVDASAALDIAAARMVTVTVATDAMPQPSPLAIPMLVEGTLEQHLQRHPHQRALPFTDLARWRPNHEARGTTGFAVEDGIWRLSERFPGAVGNWDYPLFEPGQAIDPAREEGFLLRARIRAAASPVAIMANPNRPDGFWSAGIFPADGDWHVAYIPFAELQPGPNGAGMQNLRADPASWRTLALGMNSRVGENTLEVSHFLVVGGGGTR